jgi:mRNA interferase RelE/StbE
MFDIRFSRSAEKYFKKLKDKHLKEIFRDTLYKISEDPYIGQLKTADLAGIYCYDIYYKRANYEIAYKIYESNGKYIIVVLAGSRENFYDELKRYIK